MLKYQGIGVYEDIAIGKACVIQKEPAEVPLLRLADPRAELENYAAAVALATEELDELYAKTLAETGAENALIFQAQQMLLSDEEFQGFVRSLTEKEGVNAEYAVSKAAEHFSALFSASESELLRERAADVRDVSLRLIRCLKQVRAKDGTVQPPASGGKMPLRTGNPASDGKTPLRTDNPASGGKVPPCAGNPAPCGKMILCADDLTPSEAATLDKECFSAFITAKGSLTSHAAILARSRGIPAVVGVGDDFLKAAKNGTPLLANGFTGEVFLDPDEEVLKKALEKKNRLRIDKNAALALRGKETITQDGRRIKLFANIGTPEDVTEVLENDAEGIGLFRSEFLYLSRESLPTEEEQFVAYRKVLEAMGQKEVIIRTLDLGADKKAAYLNLPEEDNPALGLRAIRLCFQRPELFKTQLRALYRASAYGNLSIMFPMITGVSEVRKALSLCAEVRSELTRNGIPCSEVKLGIMIETPAAALISDRLAPLVDFFSIGTNDLTQYVLAMDRQNAALDPFRDPHHEAVMRLIRMTAENARKNGIPVGICGELARDLTLTKSFVEMGIGELSVSPPYVLSLRKAICEMNLKEHFIP